MIKYYFKLAIRQVLKDKFISSIKVIGLTMGLFFFILTFLYVQDELMYDRHFKNTDQIYRLTGNNFNGTEFIGTQPARFLPEIVSEIPEIEEGTRITFTSLNAKVNNEIHFENECMVADSNFFVFFNWPLIIGNPDKVLDAPNKCVISQNLAQKFFGEKSAVGQKLIMDNDYDVEITGIFQDFPRQSHLKPNIIVSLSVYRQIYPNFFDNWGNFSATVYLKTSKKANTDTINKKLVTLWNRANTSGSGVTGENIRFIMQNLRDIYLRSSYLSIENQFGNVNILKGVSIVSFVILLLGLLNYIILTTSQLTNRAFEAGIRKTVGANSKSISLQMLIESILLVFIALFLTINLLTILLPEANSFLNKELTIGLSQNYEFYLSLTGLIILSILLINLNPRLYFSHVKPIQILQQKKVTIKGARSASEKIQAWIKNALVIFQFALTMFLVICLLVVNKQLHLILNEDYGFSRDQVLVIRNEGPDIKQRYDLFKEKLSKHSEITMVSGGFNVPVDGIWNWGAPFLTENKDKAGSQVGFVSVDFNYFKCLKAEIIEGRDFDPRFAGDSTAIIISESFSKILNDTNLIGKKLTNLWDGIDREIIGIVKDIDFSTGQRPVRDVVFFQYHRWLKYYRHVMVKINSPDINHVVKKIEKDWGIIAPDRKLDYFFMDEKFEQNYRKELRTRTIINILTLVALVLSCLGLIGLSLYELSCRTKEIGVRKVNGAHLSDIFSLLIKNFIQRIVIAFVIACPLAYFLMNKWLQNFIHKTELSWWIFALAGIIVLLIALLTVTFQSYKAATRNPVESLRYE